MSSPRSDYSERDIEKWLTAQIKQLNGISYKFVSPGNPGVPDRIYLLPGGRVWFVEVKTSTGRLTDLQRKQGDRIMKQGCRYRVIKGMAEARMFIAEIENSSMNVDMNVDMKEGDAE